MLTGPSKVALTIPRDPAGTFDQKLIAKCQRRFPDFDAKIISMYARGMTVREIQGHLEELYGLGVSPDLISAVTDAGGAGNGRTGHSTKGCAPGNPTDRDIKDAQVPAGTSIQNLFTCLRHGLTGSNTIHRFG